MKRLIIILIVILGNSSYAQKKNNLFGEDEKIKEILRSNFLPVSYPDSIALYTFYIKVTPQKNGINSIYTSTPLANKVYSNIDSLFRNVNFSKFLRGTKQKHIIIPVGILLYEYQNMKPKATIDIWGLKDTLPKMMADEDRDRYKSVFLTTIFIFVSTKIYN